MSRFKAEKPEVFKILNRLHTDDLSYVAKGNQEALEIYKQAKAIMLKGSFVLRKWKSNDKKLLQEINALENQGQTKGEYEQKEVIEDDQTYSQYG